MRRAMQTGLILLITLGWGCQHRDAVWRTGLPLAGMATGGAISRSISDDPWTVAAGTAGGGLIGIGMNQWREASEADTFGEGYVQGLSDSVKRQYWIQANLQRQYQRREDQP